MLSFQDIGRLTKPIVWNLHNLWAFCGAERYVPEDANSRFRVDNCADNCPADERGPNLNRKAWEYKQRRAWANQRFTFVSPSQWLADCARDSALLERHTVQLLE